jgi:hypothetical protein
LEASWKNAAQRQTSPLYESLLPDSVVFSQQLLQKQTALQTVGQFFMRSAPFYILIISAHSLKSIHNLSVDEIAVQASDASLNLSTILAPWRDKLQHCLLILDSCYLGDKACEIQAETEAAAVFGFRGKVDWTASSIEVMLLLRHLRHAGIFAETEDEQQLQARISVALSDYQHTMDNQLSQQLGTVLSL